MTIPRRSIRGLSWISIIPLLAAGPTTRPAAASRPSSDDPASGDYWARRVDRDLSDWGADGRNPRGISYPFPSHRTIAIAAYAVSPSARRRAMAVDQIRQFADRQLAGQEYSESPRQSLTDAAKHLVDVEDPEAARAMLDRADAPTTMPSKESPTNDWVAYDRAYVLISLGETKSLPHLADGTNAGEILAREFEARNRPDLAERMRQVSGKSPTGDDQYQYQSAQLADDGKFDEADALADQIKPELASYDQKLSLAIRAGEARQLRLLDRLADTVAKDDQTGPDREYRARDVIRACAAAGDRPAVEKMAAIIDARPHDPTDVENDCAVSMALTTIGARDAGLVHADRAAAALRPVVFPANSFGVEALPTLRVAGAYARLGKIDVANHLLDSIPKPFSGDSYFGRIGLGLVLQAEIDTGHFDEALQLSKSTSVITRSWTIAKVANSLAIKGDFTRAKAVAADYPAELGIRFFCDANIVYQQATQRNWTGLAGWIDESRTPPERAVLDLIVESVLARRGDRQWVRSGFDPSAKAGTGYGDYPDHSHNAPMLPLENGL